MFYKKKKTIVQPLDKTFTEREEDKYIAVSRKPILTRTTILIIGAILLIANIPSIFTCHSVERVAKDGAGDYWTCNGCGYSSNKCYEMSCSRCGKSR